MTNNLSFNPLSCSIVIYFKYLNKIFCIEDAVAFRIGDAHERCIASHFQTLSTKLNFKKHLIHTMTASHRMNQMFFKKFYSAQLRGLTL
jgi:hypothetical protein